MRLIIILLLVVFGLTFQVLGQTVTPMDSCASMYDSALNRSYYTAVDKAPDFEGGREELMKTISKNLRQPGGRCKIEGTVFVAFIIESDGQLTNRRIYKGLNGRKSCNADDEALKVLDFLTAWTPGQCYGRNVAVQCVIPVKFGILQD